MTENRGKFGRGCLLTWFKRAVPCKSHTGCVFTSTPRCRWSFLFKKKKKGYRERSLTAFPVNPVGPTWQVRQWETTLPTAQNQPKRWYCELVVSVWLQSHVNRMRSDSRLKSRCYFNFAFRPSGDIIKRTIFKKNIYNSGRQIRTQNHSWVMLRS